MQYLFDANVRFVDIEPLGNVSPTNDVHELKSKIREAFARMYVNAWGSEPRFDLLTPNEISLIEILEGRFIRESFFKSGEFRIDSAAPVMAWVNGKTYLFGWYEPYEGVIIDSDLFV